MFNSIHLYIADYCCCIQPLQRPVQFIRECIPEERVMSSYTTKASYTMSMSVQSWPVQLIATCLTHTTTGWCSRISSNGKIVCSNLILYISSNVKLSVNKEHGKFEYQIVTI